MEGPREPLPSALLPAEDKAAELRPLERRGQAAVSNAAEAGRPLDGTRDGRLQKRAALDVANTIITRRSSEDSAWLLQVGRQEKRPPSRRPFFGSEQQRRFCLKPQPRRPVAAPNSRVPFSKICVASQALQGERR